MKESISLKSMQFRNEKRTDYDKPIECQKIKWADGIFLYDPILGTMAPPLAKEVEQGVYENTHIAGHLMFELPAAPAEEKEERG